MSDYRVTNIEYAAALRQLADFYDANPEMPVPSDTSLWVYSHNREAFLKALRLMANGGTVEKRTDKREDPGSNYHHAVRKFGVIELDLTIPVSLICKKVRKFVEIDTYECPDSLLEPVE